MVARGDLGVELAPEAVPIVQQELVAAGPAAEQADHRGDANAGVDGEHPAADAGRGVRRLARGLRRGRRGDAVGGDGVGAYPIKAVEMMDRVARQVEGWQWIEGAFRSITEREASSRRRCRCGRRWRGRRRSCRATCGCGPWWCERRRAPRRRRRRRRGRPPPIVALTTDAAVCRRLNLLWGVRRGGSTRPSSTARRGRPGGGGGDGAGGKGTELAALDGVRQGGAYGYGAAGVRGRLPRRMGAGTPVTGA